MTDMKMIKTSGFRRTPELDCDMCNEKMQFTIFDNHHRWGDEQIDGRRHKLISDNNIDYEVECVDRHHIGTDYTLDERTQTWSKGRRSYEERHRYDC